MIPETARDTLSYKCVRLLTIDHEYDKRPDDAAVLFELLGGMNRAGWTLHKAIEEFTSGRTSASTRLFAVYGGQLEAEISKVWDYVLPRHTFHADVCDGIAGTLNNNCALLFGRRSAGTLRVALGVVAIAKDAGSLRFTASGRQIADRAGVGPIGDTKTVRESRTRLEKLGVITWLGPANRPTEARGLELIKPEMLDKLIEAKGAETQRTAPDAIVVDQGQFADSRLLERALHPVFDRDALGVPAFRVSWHLGRHGQLTLTQLASALDMSRQSVSKALLSLNKCGLVNTEHGLWSTCSRPLDDVATELGVADRPAKRAAENLRQRTSRKVALAANRVKS